MIKTTLFSVYKKPANKQEKEIQLKSYIRHQVPTNLYTKSEMLSYIAEIKEA